VSTVKDPFQNRFAAGAEPGRLLARFIHKNRLCRGCALAVPNVRPTGNGAALKTLFRNS
jgi:hypothetical protein